MPSLVGLGFHPPPGWPKTLSFFVIGSIARSASRRYLIYSEADFEFFAPQGRHVAPIGVKFGVEWGPKVPSSTPNFTPIAVTTRV